MMAALIGVGRIAGLRWLIGEVRAGNARTVAFARPWTSMFFGIVSATNDLRGGTPDTQRGASAMWPGAESPLLAGSVNCQRRPLAAVRVSGCQFQGQLSATWWKSLLAANNRRRTKLRRAVVRPHLPAP
jgi:hypothetical protein